MSRVRGHVYWRNSRAFSSPLKKQGGFISVVKSPNLNKQLPWIFHHDAVAVQQSFSTIYHASKSRPERTTQKGIPRYKKSSPFRPLQFIGLALQCEPVAEPAEFFSVVVASLISISCSSLSQRSDMSSTIHIHAHCQ